MKRVRSGQDDGGADRAPAFRDWNRSFSLHRRYDADDRPPRKRYEFYDPDAYERRRRRLREDSSPPPPQPPRSERLHRSESFSVLRREFPKGFRSERERSKREVSSGSSWRRSGGSGREREREDEMRSPSISSDVRSRGRSRDSSSGERGEQSRRGEVLKVDRGRVERCRSSEREEGELEPEPEAVGLKPPTPPEELDKCEVREVKDNATSEADSENKGTLSPKIEREEGRSLQTAMGDVGCNNKPVSAHVSSDKELNLVDDEEGEASVGGNEEGTGDEECPSLRSRGMESGGQSEERVLEEGRGGVLRISPPPPAKLMDGQGEDCGSQPKVETVKREETGMNLDVEQKEGGFMEFDVECKATAGFRNFCKDRQGEDCGIQPKVETVNRVETGMNLDVEQKEGGCMEFDVECKDAAGFRNFCMEAVAESNFDGDDSKLMRDRLKDSHIDKGKSLVISLSSKFGSMENDNLMEGTRGRGFELVFRSDGSSDAAPVGQTHCSGIVVGKHKDEKPKLQPLDLSLGLPDILLDHNSKLPNQNCDSTSHARSVQSLPSSFHTMSDSFTNSISFSNSQTFAHNPSCSLTQNSVENYEHSVGSRPIFQGVDQVSNGTLWQVQTSNEPKRKGGGGTLIQKVRMNGNSSHKSLIASNGQHLPKSDALSQQSSLPKKLSTGNSNGSHDIRLENSKDKRLITREISSSSLFRIKLQESKQLVLNGAGVVERIISKIVSEPLQVMGKMFHEMTEHSVSYLRESIREMVVNADKHGQLHALWEGISKRSDLTMETVSKCPRVLLEILVALKTGLTDFLTITDKTPSSVLVDIFLNLKCRNPICRSNLPVDDCDCGICIEKNGFCRECMCLVCSKFDMASNTCSWVGCDVCLHWCHTDCGLQESHIRIGQSASGAQGMAEMQFHCIACDHPSEMFGFVKEVFKTCAKSWKTETLAKELQYVKRIFSASIDSRGKRLHDVANQMTKKLEDRANLSEVINYILAFFCESESNVGSDSSALPSKEPSRKNLERSNMIACSSKANTWLPSVSSGTASHLENLGTLSKLEHDRACMQNRDSEKHMNIEKKPVIEELEIVVRFKQAEAKMYQERADDARREADSLKRIAIAKNVKFEEEYATRMAKLQLGEAEERRRQKLDELQVIERDNREYFNMKMKMEADIRNLLLKMEAIKRNFGT